MNVLMREAWRSLPLTHVVVPTLDAPSLAFDDEREDAATLLAAKIVDLAQRHRRAFTPEQKRTLAMRIRKAHLMRVSLAVGVRLAGRPRIVWEFIA